MKKLLGITILLSSILSSCKKDFDENVNCSLKPKIGDCEAYIPKYYFDVSEGRCKEFIWGGCGGVVPFETLNECKSCKCND